MMEKVCTVASYLVSRLEEFGVNKVFATADSVNDTFLSAIKNHFNCSIELVINEDDIDAFYAAEKYSKEKGVGVMYTNNFDRNLCQCILTTQEPLLLINIKEGGGNASVEYPSLIHNEGNRRYLNINKGNRIVEKPIFQTITQLHYYIEYEAQASQKIDSALMSMLTYQEPVHLKVNENTLLAPYYLPKKPLPLGPVCSNRVSHRVSHACEFFLRNLAYTPSLTELAYAIGTNRNTLTMEFQAALGFSPLAWLREQRLRKAKQYLLKTDKPICCISEEVGYTDPNHFSTSFKKRFSLSPRALRKKCKKQSFA